MITKIDTPYGEELWKSIYFDGIKTIYKISNYGRVYNTDTARILKPVTDRRKGYLIIYLRISRSKYKRKRIHSLVGEYFLHNDDPDHKTQIDHIDGNKTHNYVSNLEWVTPKENVKRAFQTGLHKIYTCEDASHAQKSNEEIELICQFMMKFPTVPLKKVSELFDIGYATLQNIRLHRSWIEISSKYDFPERHKVHKAEKFINKIDKMLISGYSIKEVINEFDWPEDFTEKEKYNCVYYRKSKLYKE